MIVKKNLNSLPAKYKTAFEQLKKRNKVSMDFSSFIYEAIREKLEKIQHDILKVIPMLKIIEESHTFSDEKSINGFSYSAKIAVTNEDDITKEFNALIIPTTQIDCNGKNILTFDSVTTQEYDSAFDILIFSPKVADQLKHLLDRANDYYNR